MLNMSRRRFSSQQPSWFRKIAYENEYNLPRLPIPQLEQTMSRYLKSISPLVSRSEFTAHQQLVSDFMSSGDGPLLHEKLLHKEKLEASKLQYPYSYIEKAWDVMYLGGRYPNPINVNPAYGLIRETESHLKPIIPRTAALVSSIGKWITKLQRGELEPDQGQCMSTFALQFGTAKIPAQGCDSLKFHPDAKHIVVMRGSSMYRVELFSPDGQAMLSKQSIEDKLNQIIDATNREDDSRNLAVFTSENRDTWARVREELIDYDATNYSSLQAVDSALFVLVLDDTSVNNKSERSAQNLHGINGRNRWFDKLQILAYQDGDIGVNFEHTFSDGTAWNRWLHEVWHDMRDSNKSGFSKLPSIMEFKSIDKPTALDFKLSKPLEDKLHEAQSNICNLIGDTQTHLLDFDSFGRNNIKKWKLSPDGAVQMALQLAFHKLHGITPATYESCATRSFLHGRTETIRSATEEARSFVQGVQSKLPRVDQKKLYQQAVEKHVEMAKMAQKGQGVDRHLFAMSNLAQEENVKLSTTFFDNDIKAMSSSFRISSSNVTMPFLDHFCFGPVVGDGYGVGYLTQPDNLSLNITSFNSCSETDSQHFAKSIQESFHYVNDLMSESP